MIAAKTTGPMLITENPLYADVVIFESDAVAWVVVIIPVALDSKLPKTKTPTITIIAKLIIMKIGATWVCPLLVFNSIFFFKRLGVSLGSLLPKRQCPYLSPSQ